MWKRKRQRTSYASAVETTQPKVHSLDNALLGHLVMWKLKSLRERPEINKQIKLNAICLTRVTHNSLVTNKPVAPGFPIWIGT